jgi:hypothetical protein
MAGTMTNEQITAEFEELFGAGTEPDEEEEPETEETEDTEEEETTEEETTEEESADEEEEQTDEESESHEEPKSSNKQSKANHAFAEQRLQIKKNEQFIRSLGKLIGFDESASIDDIQNKIKEVLIEKEAKENNISVDLAKRLDKAEEILQENDRIKLEKKVQEDFSDLIDKYDLDEEGLNEFTTYLMDNGKNPLLDRTVDIESEYLKLHYEDLVQAAVKEALAKEATRKKKVEEKAATGAPKGASDKEEKTVSSVKDLDDLFNSMDL